MDGQHCSVLTRETDIPAAVSSEAPFDPPIHDRGPTIPDGIWYSNAPSRRRPSSNRDHAARLSELTSDLGFAAFAFLSLHPGTDEAAGHTPQGYVTDVPDPWKETYERGGFHRHDPIAAVGRLKREIFSWDTEDPELCLTDAHRRVLDEMRARDLRRGIAAPVHGPQGELSVLMLVAGDRTAHLDEIARHSGSSIYWAALSSHAACFATDGAADTPRGRGLTKREKECLFWTAKGKTSWETSRIIGRTETTVNFHLKKAMSKLNACNKCHAVTKAITRGLLHV